MSSSLHLRSRWPLVAAALAVVLVLGPATAAAQRSFDARALSQTSRRGPDPRNVRTSGAGARNGNPLGRAPIAANASRGARRSNPSVARATPAMRSTRGAVIGYRLASARGANARPARVDPAFWTRVRSTVAAIRSQLSDELRHAPWRGSPNRMAGHCYVASEALYHTLGGRDAGWVPKVMRHEGSTHWFLEHRPTGRIVDPTADQFRERPRYEDARGAGFLTLEPSARARTVLERIER